jgi:hypothetical protein
MTLLKQKNVKNVVKIDNLKLYSCSLGAVHLAYRESMEEAVLLVKKADELYKTGKDYKFLIEPMNVELFSLLYGKDKTDAK